MKHPAHKRRRATLVLTVLACLALLMSLTTAWLKVVGMERRQMRTAEDGVQAGYLAAAALDRARARLAADADYRGETLQPGADAFGMRSSAAVTIRVETPPDDAQARLISVSAQVPAAGVARAQRSRTQRIHLAPQETSP